jgi:hypothetical protein
METESDILEFFGGEVSDDDRDTEYWLIEGGIAYTHNLQNLPVNLLLSSATFYAGYRHQQVETDISDDPNANDALDITRGVVIGLNLSF